MGRGQPGGSVAKWTHFWDTEGIPMTIKRPSWGLPAVTIASVVSFFGLAAWGWGSWGGLVGHPSRLAGWG